MNPVKVNVLIENCSGVHDNEHLLLVKSTTGDVTIKKRLNTANSKHMLKLEPGSYMFQTTHRKKPLTKVVKISLQPQFQYAMCLVKTNNGVGIMFGVKNAN
jgi:hypothetical protein